MNSFLCIGNIWKSAPFEALFVSVSFQERLNRKGQCTRFIPDSDKIIILIGSLNDMVLGLTHELDNRAQDDILSQLMNKIRTGEISPHESAVQVLSDEVLSTSYKYQLLLNAPLLPSTYTVKP